ncbi:MAG: ATP-binding protein [Acidobacteriota bacterium]|nr:ATP-binding protein [Acidobacteriota bacterium]MDQ7086842.1 ATP-binding protein [Acidobacteriota bacterium]
MEPGRHGKELSATPPGGESCPLCRGTGFEIHSSDHGSYARPCACATRQRLALRRRSARIPERYRHCSLEHFDLLNDSLGRAVSWCRRIVDEFPSGESFGLLLIGPSGVGKTHLAVAVLRELVEQRGAVGLFAEFNDLLRRIQETFDRRSQTPSWDVLRPALEADVLLLDDLGATRMTPWMRDTLALIINERYNQRRLILATTNQDEDPPPGQESLSDRIGERLASRLAEMCWTVRLEGKDYRRHVSRAGRVFRSDR